MLHAYATQGPRFSQSQQARDINCSDHMNTRRVQIHHSRVKCESPCCPTLSSQFVEASLRAAGCMNICLSCCKLAKLWSLQRPAAHQKVAHRLQALSSRLKSLCRLGSAAAPTRPGHARAEHVCIRRQNTRACNCSCKGRTLGIFHY